METVGGHSARICKFARPRGDVEYKCSSFSFTGRWYRLVSKGSETARHVLAGFVLQGALPLFFGNGRRVLTILFRPCSHGVSTLSQNRCEASRLRRRFGVRAGSPSAMASSPCLNDPITRSASGASNRSTTLFDKASNPRRARGLKALAKVSRSLSGGLEGAKILNQVSLGTRGLECLACKLMPSACRRSRVPTRDLGERSTSSVMAHLGGADQGPFIESNLSVLGREETENARCRTSVMSKVLGSRSP